MVSPDASFEVVASRIYHAMQLEGLNTLPDLAVRIPGQRKSEPSLSLESEEEWRSVSRRVVNEHRVTCKGKSKAAAAAREAMPIVTVEVTKKVRLVPFLSFTAGSITLQR